ncbi:TetR/AcrR family transcriptional regulator [Desulfovibrio sp. Fe33]|uniref:TetR/AcrR family transcriptional regulator n=1 Tax=Desulfovibrio sp. Fe33 TaxID=3020842 RepID=UPI00234C5BC3|nr:TetR/AcrR family transcriptional regulator [Desulfovibrio sp. Fe33]
MAKAQYDRDDILDRAVDLFWSNGFSGSSMQQVVEATGLKPGSIYFSFGNKEALFREAVEKYARDGMVRIRETLDNAPSVGEGLCRHLERFIQDASRDGYRSCFLVKTQLETAGLAEGLHQCAAAKLREIEALFQSYLEREYDEELSRDRAASIMLHIFGMRVYGYRRNAAERMRRALREGLPWLPWPDRP